MKTKTYFVKYGGFFNVYDLCYTTDGTAPKGWERITRKEAEALARAERRRRKSDPAFAYYASPRLVPYNPYPCGSCAWHSFENALMEAVYRDPFALIIEL